MQLQRVNDDSKRRHYDCDETTSRYAKQFVKWHNARIEQSELDDRSGFFVALQALLPIHNPYTMSEQYNVLFVCLDTY